MNSNGIFGLISACLMNWPLGLRWIVPAVLLLVRCIKQAFGEKGQRLRDSQLGGDQFSKQL